MSISTLTPPLTPAARLDQVLAERGFAVIDATTLGALLEVLPGVTERALAQWAPSWNRLAPDQYLRDGGRYRQRRHGSFVIERGSVTAAPHRAHWQPVEYNALHGGIERWFQPLETALATDVMWQRLLVMLAQRANALRGEGAAPETRSASAPLDPKGPLNGPGGAPALGRPGGGPWFCEAHQFRIDTAGGIGRPTPEGAHRDGVDLVAVMLIGRSAIKGGETRVFDAEGPAGQRFTMSEPGQMLLLDDARVIHETTPIQPLEPRHVGHRDTLVITLRARGFQGP
jgi:hypothetical protein